MQGPVLFFAFANDRADDRRFLRNLVEEQRAIQDILRNRPGGCEVICPAGATVDDVFDAFQDPTRTRRIVLVHFAGHADGGALIFERDGREVHPTQAGGLAEFLGKQEGLQLVFLNGCATRSVAEKFRAAGVPAVIATSRAIDDAIAQKFATGFYRSLCAGKSVDEAFHSAACEVLERTGGILDDALRRDGPDSKCFPGCRTEIETLRALREQPWQLLKGADERGRRAGEWSLTIYDPLLGVPALPLGIPPPPQGRSPFRVLARFTVEDAPIFFGRARDIRKLWEGIQDPSFGVLLLYGPTGTGKSSLLEAGLRPRLQKRPEGGGTHIVIIVRRSRERGLGGDLLAALIHHATRLGSGRVTAELLTGARGAGAADVAALWHAIEAAEEAPLLVILDQAEETITRPRPTAGEEWQAWRRILEPLFGPMARGPRGKLILSFRKEWLAEIEARVRELTLRFHNVYLAPLGRKEIVEAVEGVARDKKLSGHYHIHVEPGLGEKIAGDLLEDPDSAIAPTLQVLLSDLWGAAGEVVASGRIDRRELTNALYEPLKRGGITLRTFLKRQLEHLRTMGDDGWKEAVCETGLALDLLVYHTTPLGTAERRSHNEITHEYISHPVQLLDQLLERLDELNLLTHPARSPEASLGITRLAHDALAPVVREAFQRSDLSGQRARRIVETRLHESAAQAGLAVGADSQRFEAELATWIRTHASSAALDEIDLAAVRLGQNGTREFGEAGTALIDASNVSRRAREKQRRNRRYFTATATATIVALLIALSAVGTITLRRAAESSQLAANAEQSRYEAVQQRSSQSYSDALSEIKEDRESRALPMLLHALSIWPESQLAADRIYGLLTQRTFAIPVMGPVRQMEEPAMFQVSALGVSGTGIFRAVIHGRPMEYRSMQQTQNATSELVDLFESKGVTPPDNQTRPLLSSDGTWFAAWSNEAGRSSVTVTELNTFKQFRQEFPNELSAVAFLPEEHLVLAACRSLAPKSSGNLELSRLYFWRFAGTTPLLVSQELNLQGHGEISALHPFPSADRLAFIHQPPNSRSQTALLSVMELNAKELALQPNQSKPVEVPARRDCAIKADGRMIIFDQGRSEETSLKAYTVDGTDVTAMSSNLNVPKGFDAGIGQVQFWPGTDWLALFGHNRVALGRTPQDDPSTVHNPRLKVITPTATSYLMGTKDYFLGANAKETVTVNANDRESVSHWIFDGKQGCALPEIIPLASAPAPHRRPLAVGTTELARRPNSSESLSVILSLLKKDWEGATNKLPDHHPYFEFVLNKQGGEKKALQHGFRFGLFEGDIDRAGAAAAFSKDGRYVAVSAYDEGGFPLMVWDVESGKALCLKQSISGMEPDVSPTLFGRPAAICFGDDPATLCLIDDAGRILLWDWRRGMPFSDILLPKSGWTADDKRPREISELQWSRGKLQFDMNDGSNRYRVTYGVGFSQGGPKAITRLTQLITALTGLHADDNGNVVPSGSVDEIASAVGMNELRQEWTSAPEASEELAFCRWFIADRETRAVYPGAKKTVPEVFEFFLDAGLYDEAEILTFGDGKKMARVRERKNHGR